MPAIVLGLPEHRKMMEAIEGFYSATEFMRIYGVPRSSFYRLVKDGRLRIRKIGRASRVAKAEAAAWAESLPTFGGGAK